MTLNCHRLRDWFRARHERKEAWHTWFAWRPVSVGEKDCRWLEMVERKGRVIGGVDGSFWCFEYRADPH